MKGRYDAVELAKEIVYISKENSLYISNLQLQKVMYYVQGNFIKEFKEKAFDDAIECWPYGPVVRRVWRLFNIFGRKPLNNFASESVLKLRSEEKNIIIRVLRDKLKMNVWELVDCTHKEFPWKNANENNLEIIKDSDMERFFCQ